MSPSAGAKVTAYVQARMSSSRLPGKALAELAGRPLLWHVVERTRRAETIDEVVIVTSAGKADDPIAAFAAAASVRCFRGSEPDVLDRFYRAATKLGSDPIVRITGDCPLIDPLVVDKVVATYQQGGWDYVTNTLRCTYPDGLDVEVFGFKALEAAWREARLPSEREHVTPYIRTGGRFTLANVESAVDLSHLRWTVDEQDDLDFMRAVFEALGPEGVEAGLEQILEVMDAAPALASINAGATRNAGFYRSLIADGIMPASPLLIDKSLELKKKAEDLIPSCTQTFSKGPTQYVQGVAPVFLARGDGSHVWDVDGNEYIDCPMALGAVILGHNDPIVGEAVARRSRDGTTFSLPHPLEVEVAELLVDLIPCADMVRFGKSGSDATSGAVRVARAFTGRDVIACSGYHGWQDWFVGTTTRGAGVPAGVSRLTESFEYNDLDDLRGVFSRHPGRVAAVIMEPLGLVEPDEGFLQRVRELAHQEGALLIFDEVVTGFRLALGGAQEHFGVTPDLACFGKAMANGFPLSAVAGRREVMELFDEVFFSFTFGGEVLSLAAAKATITRMLQGDVIPHLWEQGERLKDGCAVLAGELGLQNAVECAGPPPRNVVSFKQETEERSLLLKSLFQQECLRRGVLFSGAHNLSYSHAPADIDTILRVYAAALQVLAEAVKRDEVEERLEGLPVQPVFRRP